MKTQVKVRTFSVYKNWKAAVRKLSDFARFDGNEDICCAFPYDDKSGVSYSADWDGEKGTIEPLPLSVSRRTELSKRGPLL